MYIYLHQVIKFLNLGNLIQLNNSLKCCNKMGLLQFLCLIYFVFQSYKTVKSAYCEWNLYRMEIFLSWWK